MLPSSKLWAQASCTVWQAALEFYPSVVGATGGRRLLELDRWYREDLREVLSSRTPPWMSLEELVRVVEWKMRRGVYRARNLALVRGNDPSQVIAASREAFAEAPDPTTPIARLSRLKGVGPATASAVLAAANPDIYPFFDDLVAAQIPDFGGV